ncbi:MAG: exodeoxyribonuclease V subunit alpha [Halothiobacillus sp. 14-56-357]|nr:MAG: exodeoxyribonuclease V subunit alpha [Halothiobacillus sp. 14-56-357]
MSHPSAKQMAFDLDQPSGATPINLTSAELLGILDEWVAAGWLRSIDRAVAGLVLNHAPKIPALALLALVLASHQAGQGHVCLDLNACLIDAESVLRIPSSDGRGNDGQAAPRMTPANLLQGVDLADWQAALDACPGVIQQSPDLSISDSPGLGTLAPEQSNPPFIREGAQLYLRRYWQQEQGIVAALQSRLTPHDLPAEPIRQILDALFPSSVARPDWQKIACAVAIRQRFALITGGPGTGKTTTVVKFLMLVQMRALAAGLPPRRIRLCAPTGKAAARLRQSMLGQIDELLAPFDAAFPDLRKALPDNVETVHRLIGVRPNQIHPVYRPENPLPADLVVVDEASMIGIELMAKLLAALDETTQLVLLGDQDQLASVEPGAVLGELASVIAPDAYTPQTRDWLAATTGQTLPDSETSRTMVTDTALAQAAVQLHHSYRFDSASDIGALARCVNAGDADGALTLLRANPEQASVRLIADNVGHQPLRRIVQESLASWLAALNEPMSAENQDARALAIFAAHNKAQVLCALRHGSFGRVGGNGRVVYRPSDHGDAQ